MATECAAEKLTVPSAGKAQPTNDVERNLAMVKVRNLA